MYIASGQSAPGYAYPGVNFIDGACETSNTYFSFENAQLADDPFDTWVISETEELVPPTGAGCAEIVLFVRNNGGAVTFLAHFDTIFTPEAGALACGVAALAALAWRRRIVARSR